jgi:hypothetical protein
MIQQVLPECLFEVIHIGASHKAFDFDSDFPSVFFGSQQLFSTEVNVDIGSAPSEYERIVRNCPPVFDEGVLYYFVIDVFGWLANLLRASLKCSLLERPRQIFQHRRMLTFGKLHPGETYSIDRLLTRYLSA